MKKKLNEISKKIEEVTGLVDSKLEKSPAAKIKIPLMIGAVIMVLMSLSVSTIVIGAIVVAFLSLPLILEKVESKKSKKPSKKDKE